MTLSRRGGGLSPNARLRAARVFVAGCPVARDGRGSALEETALGREFNDLVAARFAT